MKKSLKIIIAGGRNFTDIVLVREKLNEILNKYRYFDYEHIEAEVITGGADGADSLGEYVAREMMIPVKTFKADWYRLGRAAGPIRNRQMAEYVANSDCIGVLLCFWDEKSRGTANMIYEADRLGIETHIVYYKALNSCNSKCV